MNPHGNPLDSKSSASTNSATLARIAHKGMSIACLAENRKTGGRETASEGASPPRWIRPKGVWPFALAGAGQEGRTADERASEVRASPQAYSPRSHTHTVLGRAAEGRRILKWEEPYLAPLPIRALVGNIPKRVEPHLEKRRESLAAFGILRRAEPHPARQELLSKEAGYSQVTNVVISGNRKT